MVDFTGTTEGRSEQTGNFPHKLGMLPASKFVLPARMYRVMIKHAISRSDRIWVQITVPHRQRNRYAMPCLCPGYICRGYQSLVQEKRQSCLQGGAPSYIFIATATKYRYNICHKLLLWLVVGVTALYQGSLPQFGQDRTTSVVRECYRWLPLYSSHREKTWRHGDLEGQGPLVGLPQICIPLWMPIHDQIRNLGT